MLDSIKGLFADGPLGDKNTRQMIGLQMLANSGPTVGAPGNLFAGMPQAVMAGKQLSEKQADKIKEEERRRMIAKALVGIDNVDPGLAGIDPEFALKLAQFKTPKQPTPTDDIREYQEAVRQGFGGTFMDYMGVIKKAGATNINMPGQPNIGTIPQGYEAIQGPDGAWSMREIPGGPNDTSASKAAKTAQDEQKAKQVRGSVADIKNLLADRGMFDLPESGIWGDRLAQAGLNQEAVDVKRKLEHIQSNIAFDRLQQMREASPTGGALGAVSERELALLQASVGALAQDMSKDALIKTLNNIDQIMAKFEAYPGGVSGSGGNRTSNGVNWSLDGGQ